METMEEPIDGSDTARKMDEYMVAMTQLGRFSGAVLVAREGTVIHSGGYGQAEREHGSLNTLRTKFRLGSITKQFTAMAILILSEQGKLDLHDPIGKYLSYSPESWREITLHHLLNHTSGLANFSLYPGWESDTTTWTRPEIVAIFRDKPLVFRPGSCYQYCNSNYLLLGEIIEQVSGVTYEQFLQKQIFDPLKMVDSGYEHHADILGNRATGYWKRGGKWARSGYIDMGFPFAAGALYSTVEDLFRWDQSLTAGRLISPESHNRMTTITPLLSTYGYGVVMGREHNRRTIQHAGGIHGFRANFVRFPDQPACIVVLSNYEGADFFGVSRTLGAILFGAQYEIPTVKTPAKITDDTLTAYAGTYEIVPGLRLQIAVRDGSLILSCGKARDRFLPESETLFFREESQDTIVFPDVNAGTVSHFILRQEETETIARKLF